MAWDMLALLVREEALMSIESVLISVGMVWGWMIAMIGIQCVACSMAELCSAMPTSGGLYYASAVLAPQGWGPFAAWITGWSNWLSQVTAAPSGQYKKHPNNYASCTI